MKTINELRSIYRTKSSNHLKKLLEENSPDNMIIKEVLWERGKLANGVKH